jgi:hypothetical protein
MTSDFCNCQTGHLRFIFVLRGVLAFVSGHSYVADFMAKGSAKSSSSS